MLLLMFLDASLVVTTCKRLLNLFVNISTLFGLQSRMQQAVLAQCPVHSLFLVQVNTFLVLLHQVLLHQ